MHPNTYCGHPVACAAALANIAILERENLVQNAEAMGARLHAAIDSRVRDYPIVGEVRSRGLMVARISVRTFGLRTRAATNAAAPKGGGVIRFPDRGPQTPAGSFLRKLTVRGECDD